MPWQKVVRHVSDSQIIVESKSGNRYPVTPEYKRFGSEVYSRLGNIAATEHKRDRERELWAWIEFEDEKGPILQDLSSGSPTGGPPENPPWEY